MPRSLTRPLYDRLCEAYPADRAYRADDWNDGPMPDALRHFLKQVLAHRAGLEMRRLRQARTEWVAYDHADVERAMQELEQAVQGHAHIPADAWEDVLHQAVKAVTAYLVRPVPTLVSFIFDDEDTTLPIDRVRWRMQFFGPYAYLHDAVDTYAGQRSLSRLHPNTFQSFLSRIDARAVPETNDADRWMRLLAPLFTAARVATGAEAVPTSLLRAFFDEKRAAELVQCLEERGQSGHASTPRNVLRRLIEAPDAAPAGDKPAEDNPAEDSPAEGEPVDAASADAPALPPETVVEDALLGSPWPPRAPEDGPAAGAPDAGSGALPKVPLGRAPDADTPSGTEEPTDGPAEPETPEAAPDLDAAAPQAASAEEHPADASFPANDTASTADASEPGDPEADASASEAAAPPSSDVESAPPGDERDNPYADEVAPLWQQFQTTGPSRAKSSEAAEPDEQTPLWARFKPSQSASDDGLQEASAEEGGPAPGPLDDAARELEQRIFGQTPAPHREAYVRQLFKGSTEDYRQILRRIDRAASWSEASQIIAQDVFRANQINIYSDVAVTFTDAVEASFQD